MYSNIFLGFIYLICLSISKQIFLSLANFVNLLLYFNFLRQSCLNLFLTLNPLSLAWYNTS